MTKGNQRPKPTLDDVAICLGDCGRKVRPPQFRLADAPDTVPAWRKGYCSRCWVKIRNDLPLTQKEQETARSLEAWIARRRARIKQQSLVPEQFRKAPIFPELEIQYSSIKLFRMAEAGYPTEQARQDEAMAKQVERFREGAVRYIRDTQGKWRFSIVAENEEVIAQSEAYISLSNAKRGAKALIKRLQVQEPDE